MSTLILDKVLSGYNLAKVNDNFERIEKAFNEALLHRDGSKSLTSDLDVNSQKLLNVAGIEIGGVDITQAVSQLRTEYESIISGISEYQSAVAEILEEAISYGAVDQKNIGNAQKVFTTDATYAVDSVLTLPLPYIVGKNTLHLNMNHYYDMFKGVDYEEVGVIGSQSTTIKLLRVISSGVEIEEWVDGDNDLYSIYSTAEALQTLLTTSYSPESIEEFVNSVSDINELGLTDKIAELWSIYNNLTQLQVSFATTVADINTKYSTITDMYEDIGTKYSLFEALYPQLLALLSDTDFDLDELNDVVGELNDAVSDLNDLAPTIEGYKDDAETAATSAESSASSASTSATAAANSASSAASANANAQIWAEGTDTQVEYIGGEHSAKGWAEIARDFTFGNLEEALGYTVASDSVVVKHTTQTLTPVQQSQARSNIGAVAKTGDTMTGELTVVANYDVNDANASHIATTDFTMKRRSCYVGQSGNGVASPWYKVGTYTTTTSSSTSAVCLFDVASTLVTKQVGGQLRVFFRLNANRVLDATNTKLEWVTTYGNLNPDDFVLLFNSDSSSITLDLYVKCATSDLKYAFKVISEKPLLIGNSNAQGVIFNLTNNVSTGSLASLPAGTQIVSKVKQPDYAYKNNTAIVLVVAGQSNAVGSTGGTGSAYRSSITVSTGGYWNNDTGAWVSGITDPVYPTNSGSFVPSLCQALTEKTGRPVYIINTAVSNTVVASQNDEHTADQKWSSNGTLRARALQIVNAALATIGVPYELLGTVWVQGESDAAGIYNSHETLADYTTCINDTVAWFQSNIGGRFFCVPIAYNSYTSIDANVDSVNVALLEAVRKVDALVVGSDFTKYARQDGYLRDTYHFTVAGYDILGRQIGIGIAGSLNGVKTGKRITFCQPFKFPQHDAALAAAQALESDYSDAVNVWPQGVTAFRKDNVNYLIVLSYLQGGTGSNNVGIVTVYNRDSQEYIGYYLIPNMRICESIVVKTESGQDYIYVAMQGNVLGKAPVTIGSSYGSTLTATAITVGSGSSAHNIPANWFFAYTNGVWLVETVSNRVSGFGQRTLIFYDDSFNIKGQFDIQSYENDVWKSYEGLTATEQKQQWSLPRTQGIALGADGVYFMKGGGTNAADTTYRLTDIGVAHYNFQGDLVRSSVCNHTKFVNRMNGLVGVRYANTHSECEGGWIDDDGTVNHFSIINSTTGRLVVTEEFSTAPDAVDFTDCLANYYSNIPFQTNTPQFPRGNDAQFYNPFTGDKLTSIDDVIFMCAFWGLDDITIQTYGTDWDMTIGSTDISINGSYPKNGSIHIKRFTNDRFWVTVYDGVGVELPQTWLVVTDASTYAVTSCTKQTKIEGGSIVTVVESGTGYKRYSDGTQECWGGGNTSSPPAAITFPKAFSAEPDVVISGKTGDTIDMQMRLFKASAISASGFTPVATNITATSYSATTYRYYARGTWSAT